MSKARYRALAEHESVALFDRSEGRCSSVPDAGGRLAAALHERPAVAAPDPELVARLGELPGLVRGGGLDVESLVQTPYAKSPVFAPAPRRIYWELTRRCNLGCRSCFNRTSPGHEELPVSELYRLAQVFYEAGVCELRLTGGEPTRHPALFDLIEDLHGTGFYLSLGTNGVYPPGLCERVAAAPLDWIIVSLDGAEALVHEQLRGPGTFQAVLDTLRTLAASSRRLRLNTLIRRGHAGYQALRPLVELCAELGIDSLNCIPLRPLVNDPEVLRLQLSAAEYRGFIEALWRLREELPEVQLVTALDLEPSADQDRIYFKRRACAAGREGAVVSPFGEIYGCSYSPASDPDAEPELRRPYVAGNLCHEDFLAVWNDSARWRIFRDEASFKHPRCRACDYFIQGRCIGNCPIMVRADPGAFDPYCYLASAEPDTGAGLVHRQLDSEEAGAGC